MAESEQKYFYCKTCKFPFRSDEFHSEGESLVAPCPVCDLPSNESNWHVYNLGKAWKNATGPTSEAGKERVSLNGWKHGRRCQSVHFMAPAKPGKFPLCASCELREPCETEKYKYCPKDFETALKFMAAYKAGNVDDLRELAGWSQAQMLKIFSMMVHSIFDKGVMIECKSTDENGNQKIYYEKNQLIKELPSFVESLGFSANEQVMTPRMSEQKQALQGHVRMAEINQTEEIEVKRQHLEELKRMREAMQALNAKKLVQNE